MKRYASCVKRLLIFAGIAIIGVLPVFVSNTFSYTDGMSVPGNSAAQKNDTAAPGTNEFGSVPLEQPVQGMEVYPSNIAETENNNIRQIVKTYELSASGSPDSIPREAFDNAGWRYEFTDITKNVITDNATKECSVPLSVKSRTKDIDEIISQLSPTLQYSAPDGYSGLLSLDISSIAVESADEAEAEPDGEGVVDNPAVEPGAEPIAAAPAGIDPGLPDENGSTYQTAAVYTGTLSKQIADKAVYSVYFTGIRITPAPAPAAPEKQEMPVSDNRPVVTKTVVISTCFSFVCCLFFFLLFRGNVKVYNLQEGAYVLLGEARIGFTYPVINLTPFAGKAVTGSFVLILNQHVSKRMHDKTVTVNYGGKSLQHIVQYNDRGYNFEVGF